MNLYISGIRDQFYTGAQYAAQKTGEFAGNFVTVFKLGLEYARQDDRVAVAVFALANILFFEMIFLNASLADKALSVVMGPDAKLTEERKSAKRILITTFALGVFVAMNAALAKLLETNLSAKAISAVYAVTCTSYILYRLWKVNGDVKPAAALKPAV